MVLKILTDFWNAELTFLGKGLITFLIFNILFMLLGRFRFCFISSLVLIYYLVFFENRKIIESFFSEIGSAGLLIGSGAFFLGLIIWSFFIDSD